jgi:S1-C subfamily serine protease
LRYLTEEPRSEGGASTMKAAHAAVAAMLTMFALTTIAYADGGQLGVAVVDSYVAPKGAYVNIVASGSPAAAAGIVPGDVIVSADCNSVGGAGVLVSTSAIVSSDDVRLTGCCRQDCESYRPMLARLPALPPTIAPRLRTFLMM